MGSPGPVLKNHCCTHLSTRMGFEHKRAEHNGLAIHRLNHSAISSHYWMLDAVLWCFSAALINTTETRFNITCCKWLGACER